MSLNEEAKARIAEYARELKALMDTLDIRFWEGGIVRVAPVGAAPAFCTVEIEGVWDENVRWGGIPAGLVAGDEVLVWENPVTHRREIIAGSGATATKFIHDHHDDATGGDALNPATITPQTFVVGPSPAPYDALGEAVAAVVAFGPAAATPCTIQVQGIVTAEAGDVTVPQHCNVEGLDEGSTVGMGANSLIMSSDSSLADLVVTSSDPADAIRCNGVTNVTMRNVKCIQSDAADCFHFYGASLGIELYNCIAETTVANATGFHVGGTADVTMDYCKADDSTNFADALLLDASLCAAVTRWCTFAGDGDDIQTGLNSVWYYLDCHFDPANCTLAAGTHFALPTKRFNQTLIVAEYGGDFQALSGAVAYINAQADAAAGKLYGVLMLHGNFAETGDVTVPQYVNVFGMGEGTVIPMGAFTLIMSDDTSLQNVTVESSDAANAIRMNGVDTVFIRNVRVVNSTAGADCFSITNACTEIRLVDCVAYVPSQGVGFAASGASSNIIWHSCTAIPTAVAHANTRGFEAIGTSTRVLLEYCRTFRPQGTAFEFGDGLYVGSVASGGAEVTSRWCGFEGDTNDVNINVVSGTWNSYKDQFDPLNCTLSGIVDMLDVNAGDSFAFVVENTSGGAASAADLGYVDENGEYQTTATAYSDVEWCVVVIGGANNNDIWVARRGRVTVALNGNCAIGDYLYTSTTAGQAQPQSYTRPELFAVALTANAGGAGGTCEALLLCHTKYVNITSSTDILALASTDDSDWRTTINGAPVGAVVTYNVPLISGNENTIDPVAANQYGKIRLYNETDGDYALIDDVNQVANTITLTAAAPAGWANLETITTRSQTCVNPGAPPYFFDIDLSSADNTLIPETVRVLEIEAAARDTGATGAVLYVHPWEAYAASGVKQVPSYEANVFTFRPVAVPLIQQRFCILFYASGAATASTYLRVSGWWEAAP